MVCTLQVYAGLGAGTCLCTEEVWAALLQVDSKLGREQEGLDATGTVVWLQFHPPALVVLMLGFKAFRRCCRLQGLSTFARAMSEPDDAEARRAVSARC